MSETGVDLAAFDPLDPATQQCPFPHYAAMRAQGSVFVADVLGRPVYLVTRHEAVLTALQDPTTFSSKFGGAGMAASAELVDRLRALREELGGLPLVDTMLTADPPEQTRFRSLVNRAFTPRAIADLGPDIRRVAGDLADDLVAAGVRGEAVDFVPTFAVPLPVTIIARALQVPDDHLGEFKEWSDAAIAGIGTAITDDERVEAERTLIAFQHWFTEQLERRRTDPGPDILSRLVHARLDPADADSGLTLAEMLSILQQILVAGNETTTKLLTEMLYRFGEEPEQWTAMRADPSVIPAYVEESLRLASPTQGMWRRTTREVTVDGVTIPARSTVVLMYASANRDEALYPDPDAFDPARAEITAHLAFGKGIHYCLGANLARLEATVALEELTRRIPAYRLADTNTFAYEPSFMLRGLQRLDLLIR